MALLLIEALMRAVLRALAERQAERGSYLLFTQRNDQVFEKG
jgi:hypothetical protein